MSAPLLTADGVRLNLRAADRFDAVRQCGELLVEIGAVEPGYVEAMQERERSLSSYVGEAFALPHGTDESRVLILRPAVTFLQFPGGVDWDGDEVRACIAIAARSDEHVTVMAGLAKVLVNPDQAERLRAATDADAVLALLAPEEER